MFSFNPIGDLRRPFRRIRSRPTRAAVLVLFLAGAVYSFAQSDSVRPSRQKKAPSYHGPASPLYAQNASGDDSLLNPLSWSSEAGDLDGGPVVLNSLKERVRDDEPRSNGRPPRQAWKLSDTLLTRTKKTPASPLVEERKSLGKPRPRLGADKNVRVKALKGVLPDSSLQDVLKDLPPHETSKASVSPNLEADIALCGLSPCRVLLPGWIGGQDANVRPHFIQLGLLTSSLNDAYRRSSATASEEETGGPYVMVLPNVSKSRMGSCYKRPFSYHFDDTSDYLLSLGIQHAVSFHAFESWVEKRAQRPKAQLVMVEQDARDGALTASSEVETEEVLADETGSPAEIAWDFESKPDKGKHDYCLHDKAARLVFSGRRPKVMVYPPSEPSPWSDDDEATASMKQALFEALGIRKDDPNPAVRGPFSPDVYVLDWGLRSPLFPTPSTASNTQKRSQYALQHEGHQHIAFSPQWTQLAEEASSNMHPYLAVHWPMETLATELLVSCASALIHTLRLLLQRPEHTDMRTIYLATDVPLETFGKPNLRAATRLTRVREEHRKAMRVLWDAFQEGGMLEGRKLKGVKSLGDGDLNFDALDDGILALMDKTMAAKADFFLKGSERCGTQV